MYFNFVTDFSLWLTCRAKQFSSADVEGILGDDKDAYGDVKGVRKLAKKSGKVYKKDRNKSVLLLAHVKRVVVSHMPEVQKRHKNAPHQHTNNIHFFVLLQSAHIQVFSVSCITDFKYMGQDAVFDQ